MTEALADTIEPETDSVDHPQAEECPETGEDSTLDERVEVVLLTTDKPQTAARIIEILDLTPEDAEAKAVDDAVARLNEIYDETGRTFRIERVAGGYRLMTRPEFGKTVEALAKSRAPARLSQAALETLAIIAYRQPLIRAEIEAIRGVSCGEVLRSLLERHLIKIVGRAEEVGRPMLYGTSRQFLEAFGLSSLKDLPDAKELRAP